MTFQEVEDNMTRAFGYFHTWSCALAYCKVHLPNICHKVHTHAKRNGFQGILAPATDPRFVMQRFHPHVTKTQTMSYSQLIPNAKIGKYMAKVPQNEQNSTKFKDSHIVMEDVCDEPEFPTEFPQQVMDSEQLMDQLESTGNSNHVQVATQTKTKRKPQPTKKKVNTKKPRTSKIPEQEKAVEGQPNLDDFF
jgi:hypothetical protein